MGVGNTTLGKHRVELLGGILTIVDVVGSALAIRSTLAFEGPREADVSTIVLGNGDFLALHHVSDSIELTIAKALEKLAISTGVDF